MKDLDIAELTRPGGIVPVDIETTAGLVREVLRLRAALSEIIRADEGSRDGRCTEIAEKALGDQNGK